ncbi:MAG: HAD family hydrolase [Haloarculaceae archaeon]
MDRRWEAVFLDLGGVVLDLASVQRARRLFLDRLDAAFDVPTAKPDETWKRVLGEYFREREGTTFRPAREGYALAVNEILDEDVDAGSWWPLFVETAGEALAPVENAPETIRNLDEAGYYLALVSDIDAWEAEYILQLFDVRGCFDDVTTSEEVGWTKPAPEIFETAIRKAGVDPGQSLYVGDRYENDMTGGKRAGFQTVAFGSDAASGASAPGSEGTVDDSVVDFVVDDIRDLLSIADVDPR